MTSFADRFATNAATVFENWVHRQRLFLVRTKGELLTWLGLGPAGRWGERQAERYLQNTGYFLLQRNFRSRHDELDLVMFRNRTLVFVEVKSRTVTVGHRFPGTEAVGPDKISALQRCAAAYSKRNRTKMRRLRISRMRFDLVDIRFRRKFGRQILVELVHHRGIDR